MHRLSLRLLILSFIVLIVGSFALYFVIRQQSGAESILTMQGVEVCSTNRDFHSGKRRCPDQDRFITNCAEATVAVSGLPGIKLQSNAAPVAAVGTTIPPECELKTISQSEGLYALVIHAYYPMATNTPSPITSNGVRAQALDSLYSTYNNLYQSYLGLDLSTAPLSQGLGEAGLLQSFTPAFLIKGDPGFRMLVRLEDQNGAVQPGGGTKIKVSCGQNQDIMTAESDGTSWFSFEGYERLRCGSQPLLAEVMIERDQAGQWVKNTPSYSYLYEPATTEELTFRNRLEPPLATFIGKWQGVGVRVQINTKNSDGSTRLQPLAKMPVNFSCDQAKGAASDIGIKQTTDDNGRATIGLADAQKTLVGCPENAYQVSLVDYESADSPAFDFYFASPGPVLAGLSSGAALKDGLLLGQELEVSGAVKLANIGNVSGGFLAHGNIICFFYSEEAATNFKQGCPDGRTDTSITVRATDQGEYYFAGDDRIRYGHYKKLGAGKTEVRILNYKREAYPAAVVDKNNIPLDPTTLNVKDITLPTSEKDLRDHVCLAVVQVWNNEKECDPLFTIITRESRWIVGATNSSSGACGLFQSNPCSKYQQTALDGEHYQAIGNQIRWGVNYIHSRYGTPSKAWKFWQENHYY